MMSEEEEIVRVDTLGISLCMKTYSEKRRKPRTRVRDGGKKRTQGGRQSRFSQTRLKM